MKKKSKILNHQKQYILSIILIFFSLHMNNNKIKY